MIEKKFDFREYGRIDKNEIEVALKIVQKKSEVFAALIFKNISKRELHVYTALWFTKLEISVNEKSIVYSGPLASLPAPAKSDFVTLKPDGLYTTELVLLNSYYRLPQLPGADCIVKYKFENQTSPTEAKIKLN